MTANVSEDIPLVSLGKQEHSLCRRQSDGSRRNKGIWPSVGGVYKRIQPSSRRSITAIWFTILVLVLAINVALTVVLFEKSAEAKGVGGQYRIISTAHCGTMKRQILWFHLAINVLSTAVLTASGFFTQLLSSPTRAELDRLHEKRRWRLIGLKSVWNVPIRNSHRLCFAILTLTALPFHLLYNSSVFPIAQGADYTWMLVDQPAILHTSFNSTPAINLTLLEDAQPEQGTLTRILSNAQSESFRRLDQRSCIQAYTPSGFGAHSNVIVVTNSTSESGQLFAWGSETIEAAGGPGGCCSDIYGYYRGQFVGNFGDWLCSSAAVRPEDTFIGPCDFNKLLADPNSWYLHGQKVDHCLSEQVPEACSIGFVPRIMIVVVICNSLKVLVALYMISRPRMFSAENLSSVGDAVASFLRFPDLYTDPGYRPGQIILPIEKTPLSNVEQQALAISERFESTLGTNGSQIDVTSSGYNYQGVKRWHIAAPGWVWTLCILLPVICVGTLIGLVSHWTYLYYGSGSISTAAIRMIGFGRANLEALHAGNYTIIQMVVTANLPQIPLMVIYYLYTDMLTRMLTAHSWTGFSRKAKGLRVASPRGAQRGTYLLGMPLRYGIPFTTLSVVLHWTTAQTIFPVAVAVDSSNNTLLLPGTSRDDYGMGAGVTGPGFSLSAAIVTSVLLLVLVGSTLGLGFRKFNTDAPILRCSSLDISAAARPESPWTASMVEGRINYRPMGVWADGRPRYGLWPEVDDRERPQNADPDNGEIAQEAE